MSLLKTMEKSELLETSQILYHSKGNDGRLYFLFKMESLNQTLWPFKWNFWIILDDFTMTCH